MSSPTAELAKQDDVVSLFGDDDSLFGDSDDLSSFGPLTPGAPAEQETVLPPTPAAVPGKQTGGLALPRLALPKLTPAAALERPLTGQSLVARDAAEMLHDNQHGMADREATEMAAMIENALAEPADVIDLTGPEPELPAQQRNLARPTARRNASNVQRRPPPPAQVPDDVDLDTAAARWGRWCPKSMTRDKYIIRGLQPYDHTNPQDVYDFLRAVIACLTRNWPGKERRDMRNNQHFIGPSDATMHWFDHAWQMICASLRAQQWKSGQLLPGLKARLEDVRPWVECGSLLPNYLAAEETVNVAMTVLMIYSRLPAPMSQGPGSAAKPIMVG